jgi:hypothetical protein
MPVFAHRTWQRIHLERALKRDSLLNTETFNHSDRERLEVHRLRARPE